MDEPLSPEEQDFLRSFAASDAAAAAESEVLAALSDLTPPAVSAADRALAERVVERVVAARTARRPYLLRWVVSGGLAAAAAAALFLSRAPIEGPAGTIEKVASAAHVDGDAAVLGARVAEGAVVAAVGGPVCVSMPPAIHACLAEGSSVRLSAVRAGAARRLELLEGKVAIALQPLPPGERLSVVARDVWSTAVGTAFTVEVRADGAVETIVHEGKVAVGLEGGGELVRGHKIGLSVGGSVTESALEDHSRTETPEWTALGEVAGRTIEEPVAAAVEVPVVAEAPAAVDEPPVRPSEVRSTAGAAVRRAAPEPATADVPSAADLIAEARSAMREQRWADAAASYRKVVSSYPSSPESHTVLVPLARLEAERLGDAPAALRHLDAYLAQGGPLAMEARLNRIRALRALGRPAEEAAAIDSFLAAHPASLEADQLRARRDALRTP